MMTNDQVDLNRVLTSDQAILRVDDCGLYCKSGGFHIDPWRPVDVAVITHAHGDHARWGSKRYICTKDAVPILKIRLGPDAVLEPLEYGEILKIGDAEISLHSAGHILGSAQVRVESGGQVWVASGDYKRAFDPSCAPFEVVKCDVFITEATFALPIYRWDEGSVTAQEVLKWWDENRAANVPSILFGYSLGKAQRLLAELYRLDPAREVYFHGAMTQLTQVYRDAGIKMLAAENVANTPKTKSFGGELILAPPSAYRSVWTKRFKNAETGFASGWMRVRGARRRKGYDRGFVLSDHADWHDLIQTCKETEARVVLPTHGYSDTLSRYLNEIGIQAAPLHLTAYDDNQDSTNDELAHATAPAQLPALASEAPHA